MRRQQPLFYFLLLTILVMMSYVSGPVHAQCYGSLALSPSFFEYDYLVRLCVHFGDESSIPGDIICSKNRMPGEEVVEVPLFFYNAHEGINRLEFAIESNDTITGFSPQNGFYFYHQSIYKENGFYRMSIKIFAPYPVCAPALAGYAYIRPAENSTLTWINLAPNAHTHRMYASDPFGQDHYMFSPQYGGFIGSDYLYTCQPPLCEEPNAGVTELKARASYGTAVKLTWVAGEGNRTVICARTDRFPTGYNDGRLVVERETVPGMSYYFFDTEAPRMLINYYKAFSLTKNAAGEVLNNSLVECSATDTSFVEGEIEAEEVSWGSIKNRFKE
ncbi:MAG: hypothetical protein JXB45_06680 [Candidatus Krumholzibacteriota bacterium]|nr:hypothetical protein [Candidatus Krumholzibacteriota bacterium]